MIKPTDAISIGINRALDFRGRSRRSEFWWFMLFGMLVVLTAISLDDGLSLPTLGVLPDDGFPTNMKQSLFVTFRITNGPLETVAGLLLFIPLFSLMVRRLHDVGLSGYWAIAYYALGFFSGPTLGKIMAGVEAQDETIFTDSSVVGFALVNTFAAVLYLIFMTRDSDRAPNRYGPSPKYNN